MTLEFKRLSAFAIAPSKGTAWAAGFDLYAAYDYKIPPGGKLLALTDIAIHLPPGTYGRIAPRSSMAAGFHIDVGAGVIDADYCGNVGVVLFNHAQTAYYIQRGFRIAQLICEKIEYPKLVEVDLIDATPRGCGGFGSTGQ